MNPNTMTLEECRLWLFEHKHIKAGFPSLDALDRARPREEWLWSVDGGGDILGNAAFVARAIRPDWPDKKQLKVEAPDRLTCEARLCVAMWVAEGEGNK